jgi:cobalt-zinc-cadmium efflux system membrane fusion protein
MLSALVLSLVSAAAVAGSGAVQLAYELFARQAVEQDGGLTAGAPPPFAPAPAAAPSALAAAGPDTRATPVLAVLASLAAPLPDDAPPPAAAAAPAAALPPAAAAAVPDAPPPSPTLLALTRDTPTRLPDGSIFLPMAIQRLIGLRTAITHVEQLSASVALAGRIVTSRDVAGVVQATQTGVIEAPDGPVPRIGMRVAQGQLLAYQRPLLDAARRAEIDARIADLTSLIQTSEQRIARLREVWLIRYRQSKIDAVAAELAGYRRQLGIFQALLDTRIELRAHTAGVISRVNFVLGQVVEPPAVLFEIVDPGRLWVEAAAFDPAAAQDIGTAQALTGDGQVLALRFIGGGMTLQNQSLPLQFELAGPVAEAELGQPVTVLITHAHAQYSGIRLPAAALVRDSAGQPVVWERRTAETFLSHPVTAAALDGAAIGVTGGLAPDMRIVTAGSAMLAQVR